MKNFIDAQVFLSKVAQEALLIDICERPSIEACGVLLGHSGEMNNWYVEEILPLPNILDSPVYFEFAPEDLLAVELSYPGQTVGVYHSHPTGFDRASKTDCQNMQRVNQQQHIPWIWLIICGPFDTVCTACTNGAIPYDSIMAYHHFEDRGLQRIPVVMDYK